MHETDRAANLLGATALAVTDLALAGATAAAGVSSSGAAALVALSSAPGLSVTELGRRVGLSQPAAARMVDSLEEDGLVERRRGPGRWVAVRPTDAGRMAADRVLAARAAPLSEAVADLDEQDREALSRILAGVLARLYGEIGDAQRMCRLCDRAGCVRDAGVCPVGEAERCAREGGGAQPRG
ncbi:MarR family transcriptional regulator [Streptomonospora sp. PA3]|uniref:MarR family winged helix-turn-helix transcriptional regulator n=1 Tax=Streptomonospora sp. PA3 TaxID=2607326 RepID=UPI0012DBCE82|nr:MarR family transcriptional regulator [Streptomonospora sp. PA3]MUL44195.1 MarR family transcriptional regulator [Streptomonospora sp. PA3]